MDQEKLTVFLSRNEQNDLIASVKMEVGLGKIIEDPDIQLQMPSVEMIRLSTKSLAFDAAKRDCEKDFDLYMDQYAHLHLYHLLGLQSLQLTYINDQIKGFEPSIEPVISWKAFSSSMIDLSYS